MLTGSCTACVRNGLMSVYCGEIVRCARTWVWWVASYFKTSCGDYMFYKKSVMDLNG